MDKYCIECGTQIPAGRVEILPNTRTCVEHSTTDAYAARRTYSGTSADDGNSDIQIYRDPKEAAALDRLENQTLLS
tara:strand:+ start:397 stop:624 length:228 start_codon:yes stop_codon:yes gene_type:complete